MATPAVKTDHLNPHHHRIFDVGELLQAMLGSIDHPKTLAKCLTVNKKWFTIGSAILWKGYHGSASGACWETPDIERLVPLGHSPHRLSYYIGLIDRLTLHHYSHRYRRTHDTTCAISDLLRQDIWKSFRGLTIVLDISSVFYTMELLRNIFHPALVSLDSCNRQTKDGFLPLLNNKFSLHLFCYANSAVFPVCSLDFRNLIRTHPVRYLKIKGSWQNEDTSICEEILQKPNIEHLTFGDHSRLQFQDIDICCLTLRSLHLNTYHPGLKNLFQNVPNLEVFHLDVGETNIDESEDGDSEPLGEYWNSGEELFHPITACQKLRELWVWYYGSEIYFRASDMLHFAQNCVLVERLGLINTGDYQYYNPEKSPWSLAKLLPVLRFWPKLFHLEIDLSLTYISGEEFWNLALYCPSIKVLQLNGYAVPTAFADKKATKFSCLTTIHLAGIEIGHGVCNPAPNCEKDYKRMVLKFKRDLLRQAPYLTEIGQKSLQLAHTTMLDGPKFVYETDGRLYELGSIKRWDASYDDYGRPDVGKQIRMKIEQRDSDI